MRRWLIAALALATAAPAGAEERLAGEFLAVEGCAAYLSIKKQTNPGAVTLKTGERYALIAQNRTPPTHYRLRITGAEPPERWVAVRCGTIAGVAAEDAPEPQPEPKHKPVAEARYVLAISWQPAFCEGQPGKPECKTQTVESFEARNFTLHGLWPQPRGREYCGIDAKVREVDENRRWDLLPESRLTSATARELADVMPGVASHLDRHEFVKHGSCYGEASAEVYFRDSLALMRQINGSEVRRYFEAMTGKTVRLSDIRRRFDEAFGPGAGQRVRVACKDDGDRRLITELTIGLAGEIRPDVRFADLIAAALPTKGGCARGEIDRVGLQ